MAKWVDRTGEVYGALRVIGPADRAGYWRCQCTHCGAEHVREWASLRQAKSHRSARCGSCIDHAEIGRKGRVAQVGAVSYGYASPVGLIAQRLICRGLRA